MTLPTKPCPHCTDARVTDHVTLGAQLRHERERAGLSMRAMAHRMGISHTSLWEWENGRQPWPARRIEQFQSELQKHKTL